MVAILDKKEGKAVHSILQEIAQTYPQVKYRRFFFFLFFYSGKNSYVN